jgi:pyrroloquinoline quinone (PQQ) biosynthesis protein C
MDETIAAIKVRFDPGAHPYFRALEDGSFSREDFLETQIQFLFAVVFFSRPMAVLLGRMPLPSMRMGLLENVSDEHGGGNLRRSHEATFMTLLARLGAPPEAVEARALWPEVRAFNTTLTGAAIADDVPTAMAILGIIEDLFSGISARLGRGILARGWLAEGDLVHYRTHEELDVQHARDFYDVIAPVWASGARGRYQITQGLELGAYIFLRLYRDLYEARGRRWLREVGGPHSLADGWMLTEPVGDP